MISEEESIPQKSRNYRIAEDIFYIQFNDISFFIEDDDQENLYFCILKNLFPDIKLAKIFPLGGKNEVLNQSKIYEGDVSKIYLVDKDFDDILGQLENVSNLFYLRRYSIENYLVEDTAIIEFIISEKPRLDRETVVSQIDLREFITEIGNEINELIYLYVLIQKKDLGITNVGHSYEFFIEYNNGVFSIRTEQLQSYKEEIEYELICIDGRFTINSQLRHIKTLFRLESYNQYLINIPGKYILKMIKKAIESEYNVSQRTFESFTYRIADKCGFASLSYLKEEIEDYIH